MTIERQLPAILDLGGLPRAGRLLMLAGASFFLALTAWTWFHDGIFSSGKMITCILWLLPAVFAPQGRRTIIDASAIIWETVWPWGVTRRVDQMERIRRVWVDRRGSVRNRDQYFVAYQVDSGATQYLTTCDDADAAQQWVALLQDLARLDS